MAWTTPVKRAIGYLITKANDVDVWLDDLAYLKGQTGTVDYESSLESDTDDIDSLGAGARRWRNVFLLRLFTGGRRVIQTWDNVDADMTTTSQQVSAAVTGAGGVIASDGTGQVRLTVDRAQVGTARIDQLVESTGLNNAWTVTQNPSAEFLFGLGTGGVAEERVFIGFRASPAGAIPADTEIQAGLHFDGTNWFAKVSGGAAATNGANFTPDVGWNVLQIIIRSATQVDFFVNGVARGSLTTNLPTGALEWELLHTSVGGGVGLRHLTEGQITLHEETA